MGFRGIFGAVYCMGEPRREKTRNEGEVLRGVRGDFACFSGAQGVEVRFYGSRAGLQCNIRLKDRPAGTAGDRRGEGIRETGEGIGSEGWFRWKLRQR
jgi:hypothetical protein